jgi:hypothetical protein
MGLECWHELDWRGAQAELREMIHVASASGDLWTRDWDTMPLPSSLTANDGAAAAKQAAQAAAAVITAKVRPRLCQWRHPYCVSVMFPDHLAAARSLRFQCISQ